MRYAIPALRRDARQAVKERFADDAYKVILGRRLRKLALAEATGQTHVTRAQITSRKSSTAYWAI